MSYQFDVRPDGTVSLQGQIPSELSTTEVADLVRKLAKAKERSEEAATNYRGLIDLTDSRLDQYREMLVYLLEYFPSLAITDTTPVRFDCNRILLKVVPEFEWLPEKMWDWDAPVFDSLEFLIKLGVTVNFVHHFYKNFTIQNPDPYTTTWQQALSEATPESSDDPSA